MAEAAVTYVAERLIDLLQRKYVFLKNVQQEVEGVRNELVRMKCFLKDADMKHVSSVVSILLKEDKQLRVASIVGMGGVGKTTLAKEVYNQTQIRDKFDTRAWLYVSQDYKPMKIIKELILQLASPEEDEVKIVDRMDKLSEAGLEEMLQRRLEDTCYLIVLDDTWNTEAWDLIVRSFPDNDKSSRLLLTSRTKEVALHADSLTTPYELKVLS